MLVSFVEVLVLLCCEFDVGYGGWVILCSVELMVDILVFVVYYIGFDFDVDW